MTDDTNEPGPVAPSAEVTEQLLKVYAAGFASGFASAVMTALPSTDPEAQTYSRQAGAGATTQMWRDPIARNIATETAVAVFMGDPSAAPAATLISLHSPNCGCSGDQAGGCQ